MNNLAYQNQKSAKRLNPENQIRVIELSIEF